MQAVLNAGFGQGPAIVTKNYRQLGIAAPLYQSHGVASKQYVSLAGDAAEGVRLPAAALLIAERCRRAIRRRKLRERPKPRGRFKQEVSTFGGHAYDGLMLAVEAIKRAGSPTRRSARRPRSDARLHRHRRRGQHVGAGPHGARPVGVPHAGGSRELTLVK